MNDSTEMKYVLLDVDMKRRRFRVGSSLGYAVVFAILAWTGHLFLAGSVAIPLMLWRYIRGG